jgi:hypothetical protein
MNTLEDDLRSMYSHRADAMQTPVVAADSLRRAPLGEPRSGARLIALSAAALLVIAGGAALVVRQSADVSPADEPADASPIPEATVSVPTMSDVTAPRFVPSVPDGWVLLDVTASESPGDWGDRSAIYTRADPAARLELHHNPDNLAETANTNAFALGDRYGSWNRVSTGDHVGVSFDIVIDGEYVMVQGVNVDADSATVESLAQAITLSADGVPVLDPSTGFTLEAAGVGASSSQSLGYRYGRADEPGALWGVYAEAAPDLLDASLRTGAVFSDPVDVNGQRYWTSPGGTVSWTTGHTRYQLDAADPLDLIGLAQSLRPSTDTEIRQLAATIGAEAQLTASSTIELGTELTLELRTQGDLRFVCLDDTHSRACRFDSGENANDGHSSGYPTSLLLGDNWYIISTDTQNAPPSTAATTTSNGKRISLIATDTNAVRVTTGTDSWADLDRPIF